MIVVDIETSGLYPEKHGIWQIGALDIYNPQNTFLEEARIDDKEGIAEEALKITGKTEAELRDKSKQSQKQLLEHFFSWINNIKIKNCICQNPQFDLNFIMQTTRKYDLKCPFYHRAFDLHSIAQLKYFQLTNKFLIKESTKRNIPEERMTLRDSALLNPLILKYSDMDLTKVLDFCGLPDKRIKMEKGEVKEKGIPHNALEDAKLTAECFSRLVYGKPLLKEYSQYKIPAGLIK